MSYEVIHHRHEGRTLTLQVRRQQGQEMIVSYGPEEIFKRPLCIIQVELKTGDSMLTYNLMSRATAGKNGLRGPIPTFKRKSFKKRYGQERYLF